MQMVINRERRKVQIFPISENYNPLNFMQFYSRLESSKGDVYSDTIVSDFLYGKENGDDLPLAMDDIGLFDKLVAWSGEQWADLLNRYVRFYKILRLDIEFYKQVLRFSSIRRRISEAFSPTRP